MVVLDQFYQIVEAETSRIPVFWKVAHVGLFITAAVCGFLAAFTFGQVLDDFTYNCVLKSNITFDNTTTFPIGKRNNSKHVHALDLTKTEWGPPSECNFAQFTPLFTMISALVWGIFFIILAKGGAGYITDLLSRPWNIIYPCIIFCIIAFIVHLISTLKLTYGLLNFCRQFKGELGNDQCVPSIELYTHQFFDEDSDERNPFSNFFINQKIAVISSQVGVCTWAIQLVLLLFRVCCVVDFDLHLVTVLSKEEELVESVIEFHDGDDTEDLTLTSEV